MDREEAFLRAGSPAAPRPRRPERPGRRLIYLLLSLAAAIGAWRLASGPMFALSRIDVRGNVRSRTEEVLAGLEPWRGKNVLAMDLRAVAERVERLPWIERVTISKRLPDGLAVTVVERRPAALWRVEQELWWVDASGRVVAPFDARREREGSVILTGAREALPRAVSLLEVLRAEAPEYAVALSEITVLADGGFGMMDSIFRRPVRVLSQDAAGKIRALLAARGLLERRGWEARAIDLRFADRIVLVGAFGAGNAL
jgi:cell division protein FtsQ